MSQPNVPVDQDRYSNCERENVRQPGQTQSFGMLVGVDRRDLTVRYISENCLGTLGESANEIFALDSDGLFDDRDLTHALRGGFGIPTIDAQRERLGVFEVNGQPHDVAISGSNDSLVIELEPTPPYSHRGAPPVAMVRSMMSQLPTQSGVAALMDSAVISLRRLTGFDRVMGYQFLHRGEGEVVSEAKSPAVDPYLGLRYPASDIPRNAREVMVRNPFRVIRGVEDPQTPIIAADGSLPLDISLTQLRGISPIHVEYLRNMGVAAAMNIGLIVRGDLWGMFSFHHSRPKLLVPEHRSICELFGYLFSMQLHQNLERDLSSRRRRVDSVLRSLANVDQSTGSRDLARFDAEAMLRRHGRSIADVIGCDGLAMVDSTRVSRWGATPDDANLRAIVDARQGDATSMETLDGILSASDETSVSSDLPRVGETAGVLMVELNPLTALVLVLCRNEVLQNVRWAGHNDGKTIRHGPDGPELHPRSSFAEYRESVQGRCEPWTDADMAAALQLASNLRDLLYFHSDAVAADSRRQREYQDLMIAELNHRVKNILALVRSIASETRGSATTLDQYAESFQQRIAALSQAHDLIGGIDARSARLEHLVDAELKAFRQDGSRVTVSGESIGVRAEVAPLIALLVHELTSNAVKHGALSPTGQSLDVSWTRDADGLVIHWRERLREPLLPPGHEGFGLKLIRQAVPYEIEGDCEVNFAAEGVYVRFRLPNAAVEMSTTDGNAASEDLVGNDAAGDDAAGDGGAIETDVGEHASGGGNAGGPSVFETPTDSVTGGTTGDSKRGGVAIVVEDNMVLALEMESLLEQQGFTGVHSFAKCQGCRDAFADEQLGDVDVAILDVNLGTETSLPLAEWLVIHRVPIVFVSGYDDVAELPEPLNRVPKLRKPVDEHLLKKTISDVLRATS